VKRKLFIWWWNKEVAEAVREKQKKYGNLKKKTNRQRHGRSTRRVNKTQRGLLAICLYRPSDPTMASGVVGVVVVGVPVTTLR